MMSDGVSMISSKGRAMHSPSTSKIAPHQSDKNQRRMHRLFGAFLVAGPDGPGDDDVGTHGQAGDDGDEQIDDGAGAAHRRRARSFWAENRPTTATSAELNSCWSILVAAMGREKKRICFHSVPCRKSLRVFVIPLMVC